MLHSWDVQSVITATPGAKLVRIPEELSSKTTHLRALGRRHEATMEERVASGFTGFETFVVGGDGDERRVLPTRAVPP